MSNSHNRMNQKEDTLIKEFDEKEWTNQDESNQDDAWDNIEDVTGHSILITAVIDGDIDVCKQIIENGEEIDRVDNNGKTALDHAIEHDHLAVVAFLLKLNAHINEPKALYTLLAKSPIEDPNTWIILNALLHQSKQPSSGLTPIQKEQLEKRSQLIAGEKQIVHEVLTHAIDSIPTVLLNIVADYDNPLEQPRIKSFKPSDIDTRLMIKELKMSSHLANESISQLIEDFTGPYTSTITIKAAEKKTLGASPIDFQEKYARKHERMEYKGLHPNEKLSRQTAQKIQEEEDAKLARKLSTQFNVPHQKEKDSLRVYGAGMDELYRGGIANDRNRDRLIAMLDKQINPETIVRTLSLLNDEKLLSSTFDRLYEHRDSLESKIIPALNYFEQKRHLTLPAFNQLMLHLPCFERQNSYSMSGNNLFYHSVNTISLYEKILAKAPKVEKSSLFQRFAKLSNGKS